MKPMRLLFLVWSSLTATAAAQQAPPVLDLDGFGGKSDPGTVPRLPLPPQMTLDPETAGPAQRIWCATMRDQQEVWFRRSCELRAAPKCAQIVVSCDNWCEVFVNGKLVGACDDHGRLTVIDIDLEAGRNVVAVHARNTGGPAALVLWLTWTDAKREHHEIVSDQEWRSSDTAARGCEARSFDDSEWPAAVEHGLTPFGRNVYGGVPQDIDYVSRYFEATDEIEKGVQALRHARDAAAALEALEGIERAVMRARAVAWAQRQVERAK